MKDLTHVTGIINDERYIKHEHSSTKYRPAYYEDVLVFSIQGCPDEFGFMEYNIAYPKLKRMHFGNNETVADIYYDKSGQRIEENVTLHTFDLKIDDESYVMIADIQKNEMTGALIFSSITMVLTCLTYIGAKRIRLKG